MEKFIEQILDYFVEAKEQDYSRSIMRLDIEAVLKAFKRKVEDEYVDEDSEDLEWKVDELEDEVNDLENEVDRLKDKNRRLKQRLREIADELSDLGEED